MKSMPLKRYGDLDIAGMDIREPKQNLPLYVHCHVETAY
jgi:hypothetical protein